MNSKKVTIITLIIGLVISLFVLYTPKPVLKDVESTFSSIRAAEHIEVISRKPHSYFDQPELEEVRLYIEDTMKSYIGDENVSRMDYTYDEVKSHFKDDMPEEHKHGVSNILGVIPGKNKEGILLVAHFDSRGHVGRSGEMGRSYGAMDDGYGVSSMLELAYLYKDKELENSIYFLFADAEEVGLYGSTMASLEEELMENVKFVMNLESRGRYGPVYMFETSKNNSKVIDLYKHAKLPVTYSMATAVYSVMPNFTDFTPFIDKGVPGMNFATLAGLENYHSPTDSYENINLSSIQHMGVQVKPIIDEFVSNDKYIEDNYFDAKNDKVFFTILPNVLISYSETFAVILLVIILLSFAGLLVFKLKNKELEKSIFKTLLQMSIVFISAILIGVIFSMLVAFFGKVPFNLFYTRVNKVELPTVILLVLISIGMFKLTQKSKNKNEVLLNGIIINLLLTIITTFTLKGASFLFAMTTLFGIISLAVSRLDNKVIKHITYFISYTFLLSLIVPLIFSFYMALTVGGVAILVTLLALSSSVIMPIIGKQLEI